MSKRKQTNPAPSLRRIMILVGVLVILAIILGNIITVPLETVERELIKVPYTKEGVVETSNDTLPEEKIICENISLPLTIKEDEFSPYIKPFGLDEYKCYAELVATNNNDRDGKWTIRYVFVVNNKSFPAETLSKFIYAYSSVRFKYELDICKKGDKLRGYYEILNSPRTEQCKKEIIYPDNSNNDRNAEENINKTFFRLEERKKIAIKKVPLWKWILSKLVN